MADVRSHLAPWRAGVAAIALVAGLTGLASIGGAQAPAKKAPEKAAPAKGAKADPSSPSSQAAWVKLCEPAKAVGKDKDGKEVEKSFNICMTLHERLDANSGMTVVSAGIRSIEGQDKQYFLVMVPAAVLVKPGMRATFMPKDIWEKALKNEKIDDKKLKEVRLEYTACHPGGCTAEIEATPEIFNDLKTNGGFMVTFAHVTGQPVAVPVTLEGFSAVFAGAPADNKAYTDARRHLMAQIAERQQHMMEEYKKQQGAQKSGGAAASPGGAAPPAKAPPAKK